MIDIEDDIFQALCELENLSNYIEQGGTIEKTADDVVTIDLPDGSFSEINLAPVEHLLRSMRSMK